MGTQFDIIKRPEPWTLAADYVVKHPVSGLMMVCPIHASVNGVMVSIWADSRAAGRI